MAASCILSLTQSKQSFSRLDTHLLLGVHNDISKILVDCKSPIPQNQTLEIPSISLDPKDPKHGMQCLPEALKGFPGRRSQ